MGSKYFTKSSTLTSLKGNRSLNNNLSRVANLGDDLGVSNLVSLAIKKQFNEDETEDVLPLDQAIVGIVSRLVGGENDGCSWFGNDNDVVPARIESELGLDGQRPRDAEGETESEVMDASD